MADAECARCFCGEIEISFPFLLPISGAAPCRVLIGDLIGSLGALVSPGMRTPWAWSRTAPPVPPPETPAFGWPTSPVQYVFCASFLALSAWLIWARFFARRSSGLLSPMWAWLYIPIVVVLMPLMHSAVNGMCEDIGIDLAAYVPVVDNKIVMVFQVRLTVDSITVDSMHTPPRHAHAHTTHTSRRLRRWWSSP